MTVSRSNGDLSESPFAFLSRAVVHYAAARTFRLISGFHTQVATCTDFPM